MIHNHLHHVFENLFLHIVNNQHQLVFWHTNQFCFGFHRLIHSFLCKEAHFDFLNHIQY